MKTEIKHNGPITCSIKVSQQFIDYKGGVLNDIGTLDKPFDHEVSVVGWINGQYWIVRNSWGTFWGDYGYAYVAFGSLSIEQQCTYATV